MCGKGQDVEVLHDANGQTVLGDAVFLRSAHGQFQRASMESGGGRDPIFLFWVYQPSTVGDASGQSLL